MRRPTPLVLPVAAIMVAVGLMVAPAAGAALAHRYDVSFTLHTQGFVVQLGHESDEDTVKLSFTRGGPKGVESVQYETKATITPRTLEARFGRLGRLDLRFRPVPSSDRKGTLRDEGTFPGRSPSTARAATSISIPTAPTAASSPCRDALSAPGSGRRGGRRPPRPRMRKWNSWRSTAAGRTSGSSSPLADSERGRAGR